MDDKVSADGIRQKMGSFDGYGEIDGRASAASSGSPELGEESTNVPDSTSLSSVASDSAGTAEALPCLFFSLVSMMTDLD
jgi:hypothetical protein